MLRMSFGASAAVSLILLQVLTIAPAAGKPLNESHLSSPLTPEELTSGTPGCNVALLRYEVADPLHTAGDRAVDALGKRYAPDGVSDYGGLEQWNGLDRMVEQAADAQIRAATGAWHVNTVRLQVAQGLYFRDPGPFLQELDREVGEITCRGAIVVINDNTLFTTNEPAPTHATLKFMKVLAARYKDLNNVILDPFNEPRLEKKPGQDRISQKWMWRIWQVGGRVAGVEYVGMQALVNAIRREGSHNLVWVEGPLEASSFSLLGRYPIRGTNIEFEFHHPRLDAPWTWRSLIHETSAGPEVEGEESQYSSATRPECHPGAYTELPKLLRQLAEYHDGLVAWTLEPGVLVASRTQWSITDTVAPGDPTSAAALTKPTRLRRDYACVSTGVPQGMGQLAMAFFKRHSARDNPYSPLNRRGHLQP